MHSLQDELDIIIAQNRALISGTRVRLASPGISSEPSSDLETPATGGVPSQFLQDDCGSTMLQELTNRFEHTRTSLVGSKDVSARDLVDFNDALRSCGMQPLPRDAGVEDVVCCSIRAINELATRTTSLQDCDKVARRIPRDRSIPPPKPEPSAPQCDVVLDKLSDQYEAVCKENKELRKLVMQWKSEANSLSHLLKSKENEVNKLQTTLKDRIAEDDRRSALAMTTIREQNMPHTSLIVLNNMQKRISNLEQENVSLAKQNTRLCNTGPGDKDLVTSQLEQSNAQLAEMTRKYYTLVEETNHMKKSSISDSEIVSKVFAILGEDPKKAVKTVKDMQKIVTEIFPPIDAFVTRVTRMVDPGMTGPIDEETLARVLARVMQWAQDSATYTGLVGAKRAGPLTEQERIDFTKLKALEMNVCETFGIPESQTDSLIPYLGRVKFKCDEFRNFFKQAAIELGFDGIPTYAAFMEALREQLGKENDGLFKSFRKKSHIKPK